MNSVIKKIKGNPIVTNVIANPLLFPLKIPESWITLAWVNVVQSYRRTFLGPFWITLNMVIFSIAMTLVYGALFGLRTQEYSAYLVCGMMAWFWISALLTEGGSAFQIYGPYIKGIPIDKSQFVWSIAFKQLIVLAHNMVVYVAIVLMGFVPLNAYTLQIIPSVALVFLMSVPIVAILSILYIRYRDLQKLVGSTIIIIMLLSPIFWYPDRMTGWRSMFVYFNPNFYILELIRNPLLGREVPLKYYLVMAGITAFLWVFGGWFYKRYQRFVVFWL